MPRFTRSNVIHAATEALKSDDWSVEQVKAVTAIRHIALACVDEVIELPFEDAKLIATWLREHRPDDPYTGVI